MISQDKDEINDIHLERNDIHHKMFSFCNTM